LCRLDLLTVSVALRAGFSAAGDIGRGDRGVVAGAE
jgi:hypothetical protein